MLFGNNTFKQLIKLYYEAQEASEGHLGIYADRAISLLSQIEHWPKITTQPEYLIKGNLYFFRAKAKSEEIWNDRNSIAPEKLLSISEDFEQSLRYLCQKDKVSNHDRSVFTACYDYAEIIVTFCPALLPNLIQRIEFVVNLGLQAAKKLDIPKCIAQSLYSRGKAFKLLSFQNTKYESHAIADLEKALEISATFPSKELMSFILEELTSAYLLPTLRQDQSNIEKAIVIGKQYEELAGQLGFHPSKGTSVLLSLADAFRHRIAGDRLENLHNTEILLVLAFKEYDDAELIRSMPMSILNWIEVIVENRSIKKWLQRSDTLLTQLNTYYIEHAPHNISGIEEVQDKILKVNLLMCDVSGSAFHNGYSQQLQNHERFIENLRPENNISLWADTYTRVVDIKFFASSSISAKIAADTIKNIIIETGKHGFDEYNLVLNLRLGIFLTLDNQINQGKPLLVKNVDNILGLPEEQAGNHKGFSQGAYYSIPLPHELLNYLCFCLVKLGEISKGLQLFDILNARRISDDAHLLSLIEPCQMRDNFMATYIDSIRVRHLPANAPKSLDEASIRIMQKRQELHAHLKTVQPDLGFSYFYANIDNFLSTNTHWIFVPIITNLSSVYVLIPPHASFSDAIIYEHDALNTTVLLQVLATDNDGGWLSLSSPAFNELEPVTRFKKFQAELGRMQDFLWDHFGQWLEDTVPSNSSLMDMSIITSGALQFLPFALTAEFDEFLIDRFNMSAYPSLYGLFLLQRRLETLAPRLKHDLCIVKGFEGDEPLSADAAYSGIEAESALIKSKLTKSISHVDMKENDLNQLKASVEPCDLWHFSAHSNFSFGSSRHSTLMLGDYNIPSSHLSFFEPKQPIRTVFFASCESGLLDFISNQADATGFLENAMELGALSCIGVQWLQPDRSVPLITSQFYFNLIEQKQSPAQSLASAQRWVRDATTLEIITFLEQLSPAGTNKKVDAYKSTFKDTANNHKPFEAPQYWAGFSLRGV